MIQSLSQFKLIKNDKNNKILIFLYYYYQIKLSIINFILMERLKEKQIQILKEQKKMKAKQQDRILQQIIKEEQSLQIILKYTQQYFKHKSMENISEYTPIQISRLVFDKQLEEIKTYFEKFPDGQVNIEHFIIIMMKVMKFSFEVSPFYMVGLKDMFYEIVEEGAKFINYPQFFKYILGQLVMMKEQQQNTQFQVQIVQKTKQDYLMHDNGIKRIKYSKDLKIVFSLDERSNVIKLYDSQMKSVFKFSPKKQKHGNKFPSIIDFDYSQISSRLGMLLSDDSISTVYVPNLLKLSPTQFEERTSNQIVYYLEQKMTQIYFIQMLDKWMTINETGTEIYLYDMEKILSHFPNQKIFTKIKLNLSDLVISKVLEIVPLSCICIIAGNQVNFYNQNLTDLVFKKFVHVEDIMHFKYSDDKNQFYVCGLEKSLTMFSMSRYGYPSKLVTISINKIIADFEIFPYYDTIVISDENNDLRLIHEPTKVTYQLLNYSHIVKTKDKMINMIKITKNQFCIYQTYLIVINQQKIAIEKDTEYSILPYYYIDKKKDELYISVNHQIISFSLISGQIRKNYSIESSNLQKHHSFFILDKTPLFILDHEFNIYEIYGKDQSLLGENQNYRKKVNIQDIVNSFYDKNLNTFIIVSKNTINQIRNDSHNNFNLINTFNLNGFNSIIKSSFCQRSKYLTFLTNDQLIYIMKNYEINIQKCYKFIFPKDNIKHEESMILNYHYVSQYDAFIILTNKNEVYFVQRDDGNQFYFDIQDHLPAKLKHLKFINFRYQKIQENKNLIEHYILLSDQSGFIIQFSLTKIYQQFNFQPHGQYQDEHPIMIRQTHRIQNDPQMVSNIQLMKDRRIKRKYEEIGLLKAHDKIIVMAMKIKLEIIVTLTISIDGYIKLWNQQFACLFNLKIPSLMKCLWNMKEIQIIKNQKSINELLTIFKGHFNQILTQKNSPIQNCTKSKQLKNKEPDYPAKLNYNDPFKIQIENKDIQQIVMQKQDFSTFYSTFNKIKMNNTHRAFNTTQKIYPHPWRTKREFKKIYQKASPNGKYQQKMPKDLLDLRNSLDMTQKVLLAPNYKQAEKILPQLSFYEPQQSLTQKKKKKNEVQNEEQGQNFQSCLYVKTINRKKKKVNEFDEIDKQFKKKQLLMTARKWVPKKQKFRNPSVSQIKQEISLQKEGRLDPIKAIFNIFQAHNRQVMDHRKGRIIKIPKINRQID